MKKIIRTPLAPTPIGPYNQAVLINKMLYTSGQIPLSMDTGLVEMNDIQLATKQVMEYLKQILIAAEMNFENVIKVSIFIKDMNDFQQINKVYARYFDEATAPARETVEVARLPKDAPIEISLVASKDS